MQQTGAEATFDNLARLTQKPGVQSTLILSRQTGAIVRSSGLISREETTNGDDTLVQGDSLNGNREDGVQSAEDVARLVWNFTNAAGSMLSELNGPADDEVKLLRLRTKKKELVIVPDPKFIAVVIHETPPA